MNLHKILAENMLRFGSKNLSESNRFKLQVLAEQAESTITIQTGCILCCATKTNTTNISATKDFISSGNSVEGTITNTTCISRPVGSTSFKVAPKTVNLDHYLKIGNKLIQETSTTYMAITIAELDSAAIEASGNGIYALGRAISAASAKGKYGLTENSGIIIMLNAPAVTTTYFNISSGFQDLLGAWKQGASIQMIADSILEPAGNNDDVTTGKNLRGTAEQSTWLQSQARPMISTITADEKEKLKTVGTIDPSGFPLRGKKITSLQEAKNICKQYTDRYLNQFLSLIGTRFRYWVKLRSEPYGVPDDALAPIYSLIYRKVTQQQKNSAEYTTALENRMQFLYQQTTSGPAPGKVGAVATGATVGGKEGEIAPNQPPKQ